MHLVNRGFIIIRPTSLFLDWAKFYLEDLQHLDLEDIEPTIYMIEEEFIEIEPLIKKNYKKIFLNELMTITSEEEQYPLISLDLFHDWFTYSVGSTIVDCQSEDLVREEI